MGAGLLPVAIKGGMLYFLFGMETYNNLWSDFGGKSNINETLKDTALREGYEELDGFLGSISDLKKNLEKNFVLKISESSLNYSSFLIKINYDDNLPFYFNNHHQFIKKNFSNLEDRNGFYEKKKIKCFTIKEMKKERSKFRNFYREIIDIISENENLIMKKIK